MDLETLGAALTLVLLWDLTLLLQVQGSCWMWTTSTTSSCPGPSPARPQRPERGAPQTGGGRRAGGSQGRPQQQQRRPPEARVTAGRSNSMLASGDPSGI